MSVSSNSPGPRLWASQPRDFEAAQITGNKDWPATPLRHYAFKGEKTIRLTLIYLISLKRKKQGHAFHVCSGHICRIGLAYCILFLTLPVFTSIEQQLIKCKCIFCFYVKEKNTFTPSSVASRCLIERYFFSSYLIFNAIMCFHMISRRILFTKNVQKTLKMCVLDFCVSPVCMIKTFLYGFFWLVASIPNFVAEGTPDSFVFLF